MNAKKYLLLLVCLLPILFYSCHNAEEKYSETTTIGRFGKYVYIDDNGILHLNPHCSKLINGKDDDGHDIYAKQPIDTANFRIVNPESFRVCAYCVSDKGYEHLLKISEINSYRIDTVARFDYDY